MTLKVTARHCEISDELRVRTQEVIDRLAHYAARPVIESTAIYDVGPDGQRVELRLHLPEALILVATAEDKDHRTALDRAEAKIRKQLEKVMTQTLRERRRERAS